jgi:phosphoribosyl-ATP pyrophosphohydrolase/phosphoribosyl-AMP cyclohydrolase
MKLALDFSLLNFDKNNGLVTIVAQEVQSSALLMVAYADKEALEKTVETGQMHYHSRSRGLWRKGSTSGNTQEVVSLSPDCDGDAILAKVKTAGPACHLGTDTCFGPAPRADVLSSLDALIGQRALEPASVNVGSYTKKLLADRNLRLKKLGEEAAELVIACADNDAKRSAEEAADVLYHLLVALRGCGVGLPEVLEVLSRRASPRKS